MQAIITKFICATNFRGSRIEATCAAASKTLSYDHTLDMDENHAAAARTLAESLGWLSDGHQLSSGSLPNGTDCHVLTLERSLAHSVIAWSVTPGEHGGNPYCKAFVKLAERILA